jgi:hypothetical protein
MQFRAGGAGTYASRRPNFGAASVLDAEGGVAQGNRQRSRRGTPGLTVTAPPEAPALPCWTAQPQLDTPVALYDLNSEPEHLASLAVLSAGLDVIERDGSNLLTNPIINEASN